MRPHSTRQTRSARQTRLTRSIVAATVLLSGLLAPSRAAADEPASRPNVVIVITDDQGYGDVGCHGNPILKTPHIDQLHADSVRLADYHVAPTCSPTRAALLTGHWTNRTGVWHTIMGRSMLRRDEVTIGEIFRQAGYQTGMFGKWHLGDNHPYRPEDRGFTEVVRHGGGGVGQTPDYWDNAYFGGHYWHNGEPIPAEGFCTDVFFDHAKRFIRECRTEEKPFLAYISTNAPHGPMHAPEAASAPYRDLGVNVANFFGMIANIDENLGALREFLREEGLEENTILIFTTDNGTAAGDRVFNAGMRGKKGSEYDGGHRVPFFVRWPGGGLTGGRDVTPITAHVDVVPTLADWCGVTPPDGLRFDGVSLRSLFDDTAEDWPDRILVTDSQRVKDPIKWRKSAVMTSRWRLNNRDELYDIQSDPEQQRDVSGDHPEVVERLRAFYESWWAELEPSFADATAIDLGHPAENPARLTSHDWITTNLTPWNQAHVRAGMHEEQNTGFWNVNVVESGEYEIRLRRWPAEIDAAIDAPVPPGEDVPGAKAYRTTPGKAIPAVRATLTLGDEELATDVAPGADEARFRVQIPAGKTTMAATFVTADGETYGAYYAYVELTE